MPQHLFVQKLLHWHLTDNHRDLPWKNETNPYKIWLSEIILQQTRSKQAIPYYYKLIKQYKNIHQLAQANLNELYKLWEGLGYYSRCKNLWETANFISKTLNGIFPNTWEGLLELKGVGTYTDAAIGSFAFKLPYPVVDGNVYRVLSRYFGIQKDIQSSVTKKYFFNFSKQLIDPAQPHHYNQAVMDFGATVCKPKLPLCFQCLFQTTCWAYKNKKVLDLPIKNKKIRIKKRYFISILFQYQGSIYLVQRNNKDVWKHLWEFYTLEKKKEQDLHLRSIKQVMCELPFQLTVKRSKFFPVQKQRLTHQVIFIKFVYIELQSRPTRQFFKHFLKIEEANCKAMPLLLKKIFKELEL